MQENESTNEVVTTSHEEIRQWAEKYKGRPQVVHHPSAGIDQFGLRIDLPGKADDVFLSEDTAQNINWDEFFQYFEELGLAFVYTKNEEEVIDPSWGYKFIKRQMVKN
jgi:hypothetical protein